MTARAFILLRRTIACNGQEIIKDLYSFSPESCVCLSIISATKKYDFIFVNICGHTGREALIWKTAVYPFLASMAVV